MDPREFNYLIFFITFLNRNILSAIENFNFNIGSQQDVIFINDLIVDVTTESLVSCAMTCASDPHCLTFTFSQRSRSCRGHCSKQTLGSGNEETSNTYVFHKQSSGRLIRRNHRQSLIDIGFRVCACISKLL